MIKSVILNVEHLSLLHLLYGLFVILYVVISIICRLYYSIISIDVVTHKTRSSEPFFLFVKTTAYHP